MGAARAMAAWGGWGEAAGATHTPSGLPRPSPHAIVTSHTPWLSLPPRSSASARRWTAKRDSRGAACDSGVIDPKGCEQPRPHAAAGTTGVAAVRGGAGRRGPHPTTAAHVHTPTPSARVHGATPLARGGVRDVVCGAEGGGREAVRSGHHTPHTACRSPRTSHSSPEHRPSTQLPTPWPPAAPAAGPAAGVLGRRCRRLRHRFRRHGTPLSHHVPARLSGVRPCRRRRLSRLGTGREPAARAQLRLVAGTLAACPEVPGHVSIPSHRLRFQPPSSHGPLGRKSPGIRLKTTRPDVCGRPGAARQYKTRPKRNVETASQVVPHMAQAGQRSQMRSDGLSKKPRGSTPPPDIRMPVWDGTVFTEGELIPKVTEATPYKYLGFRWALR